VKSAPLGVAVAGLGTWGPNLTRCLATARGARLAALCDVDPRRLAVAATRFPGVRTCPDLETCLKDPSVQAVILAVPAALHERTALKALRAGRHVLVEKPIATTLAGARRMDAEARRRRLVLGVGHTFEYHPAVAAIRTLLRRRALGRMHYILSRRLSMGSVRTDVDALWNLAPHDVSILTDVLGGGPRWVSARGGAWLSRGLADLVTMEMGFPGNVLAQVQVSWLFPLKVRETILVGEKRMMVFNDVAAGRTLQLYDRSARDLYPRSFGEFRRASRSAEGRVLTVPAAEPLAVEVQDFVDACRTGRPMRANAGRGILVTAVLEAASRSMAADGRRIPFLTP